MPTNLRTTGFELPVTERLQRRLRELTESDPRAVACYRWIRESADLDVAAAIQETKQFIANVTAQEKNRKWGPEELGQCFRIWLYNVVQKRLNLQEVAQLLLWELEPEIGFLLPYHPRPETDYEYEEDADEENDGGEKEGTDDVATPNEE